MRSLRPVPDARPRAILYLRQSVARDDSISIELQETAGRDYCDKQGYDVAAVEVDEGLSGRNWSKRPAVHRVMEAIERRDADIIVLWKWSRLSRNRKDWALAADRVEVAGGRIESATEPIDTATASGRFARGVMTEYAAFQSEQIGEQWQEVFARRAKLGMQPTGVLPWGWETVDGAATISAPNAATIRAMYQLYAEGSGLVGIANWMNSQGHRTRRGLLWQFASVRACLESPFHAGYVSYSGKLYDGAHEPIVSRDDYARFIDSRQDRSNPRRPRTSPYLLSTIITCHCGRKRVGNASGRRQRSYVCSATETHPHKSRVCAPVDALVAEWVTSLDVEAEVEKVAPPVDMRIIQDRQARVRKALTNLNVSHAMESISDDEHESARAELVEELDALNAQVRTAAATSRHTAVVYLAGHQDLLDAWPIMTTAEQQSVLRALVHFVRILPDDSIEIHTKWGDVVHKGSS